MKSQWSLAAIALSSLTTILAGCEVPGATGLLGKCINLTQLNYKIAPSSKVVVDFKARGCDGEAAAGMTLDLLEIRESKETISECESAAKLQPNPKDFVSYTVLVLDMSGSVREQVETLKSSADAFIKKIFTPTSSGTNPYRVAIYAFDQDLRKITEFSGDPAYLSAEISRIRCGEKGLCGNVTTNLYGAVVGASQILASQACKDLPEGAQCMRSLVFYTDGSDRAQLETKSNAIAAVKGIGNLAFAVSLGSEIDKEVLEEIAKGGVNVAAQPAQLAEAFGKSAQKIRDEANSYYTLEYFSPARRNMQKLEIHPASKWGMSGKGINLSYDAGGFTAVENIQLDSAKCRNDKNRE